MNLPTRNLSRHGPRTIRRALQQQSPTRRLVADWGQGGFTKSHVRPRDLSSAPHATNGPIDEAPARRICHWLFVDAESASSCSAD